MPKKHLSVLLTTSIILLTLTTTALNANSLLEAQLLALEMEGQLRPSEERTEQIYNDLFAVRSAYPEVAFITYQPHAAPDEIMVGLTKEAAEQFRNGQYHALDELNETYGVIQVDGHSSFLILKFDQIYNTELLSQIYIDANLQGVRYAEPNYRIGDGSTIVAQPPFYVFIHGWGDCPSGCINHKYWYFKVEDGQVIELNEFYVDAVNGDDNNLGLSPETAFATIQKGINSADDRSTVIVLPGTYTGPGNRDIDFLGKAIAVRSTDPNDPEIVDATIIDCNGTETGPHRGFYFHSQENANSVLNGLTIINGYAPETSYPGFSQKAGGGIFCSQSSPEIINCVIRNNFADDCGGGLFLTYTQARIINCRILMNSTNGIGGGIDCSWQSSKPHIYNCIISDNTSVGYGGGIGIKFSAMPVISNCTIACNTALKGGGIATYNCFYSGLRGPVTNCIVWYNQPDQIEKTSSYNYGWFPIVTYCNFSGILSGNALGCSDNIHEEPLFIDLAQRNYNLLSNSPCIDAGDPNYIPEPNEIDFDGNPRVLDGRIDIGAYEFNPNAAPIADAGPNQIAYADHTGQAQVTLDGSTSWDPDGDDLTYYWNWIIDANVYEANEVNPTIGLPVGQYSIELIVNDGTEDSEPNYCDVTVIEPINANLYIYPKSIVRYNRAKRIMAIMRLPEGVDKADIDPDVKLTLYPSGIEATRQFIFQRRKRPTTIIVYFDKDELTDAIDQNGRVTLSTVGQLNTGQYFYGDDFVRIRTRPLRPPRWRWKK